MSNELIICGAAYGKEDVTTEVRKLQKSRTLFTKASNDVFGDQWPGTEKSLVVVYKYGNSKARLQVVEEGKTLVITPRRTDVYEDNRPFQTLEGIDVRRKNQFSSKLNILGAAYGLRNVTHNARRKVTSNQEFKQMASNAVWGNGWRGVRKTLVVVYENNSIFMVDIAVEGSEMHFIASPPLTILGAAYGLTCVTDKVEELVRSRSVNVIADNATFRDGWRGTDKTLVIAYQYGAEEPKIAIAEEGNHLQFMYSQGKEYNGPTDPKILTILAAAYGLKDVTSQVQRLVKGRSYLYFKASNAIFGDTWKGTDKSMVVVYRYGRNAPQMKIAEENSIVFLSVPTPRPYAKLLDPCNLLEDGDCFALVALNRMFVSCDSESKLIASGSTVEKACQLIVKKSSESPFFKIQSKEGKFVIVGNGNYLYTTSTEYEADLFSISVSTKGDVCFATKDGFYVSLDSRDGNHLKADAIDYLSASTMFDIAMQQTTPISIRQLQISEVLSKCDQAVAKFLWQLVPGFFLAIGLGPYLLDGVVRPGLLNLLKANEKVWSAIVRFKNAIIETLSRNVQQAVIGALAVIGVIYEEGLLWTIFKMVLDEGKWWIIGTAIAKIIEIVFMPGAEAVDLLTSFVLWARQFINSGLELGKECLN